MAEEKSNLEPLDEKDLDFKAKFLGVARPKKPESVIAEVKEETIPMPKKNIKVAEKVSNLEPIGNEDLALEAKFSGVTPPKRTQEAPQKPMSAEEKSEFPKMAIAKKTEPISSFGPADEKNNSSRENFSSMSRIKMAQSAKMEKIAETVPQPEATAEKNERHFKQADNEGTVPRMTISRPAFDKNVADDARMAARDRDVENKIETLVRLAEMKGIPHAVKVAQHLDDNYTLDEFHDYLLTEELHEALVRRGLIEET